MIKARCTWASKDVRCRAGSNHEETANNGEVWARLCDKHHQMLDDAIGSDNPAKLCGAWIAAQGGPACAMDRL